MLMKMWGKSSSCLLLVGVYTQTAITEISIEASQKINSEDVKLGADLLGKSGLSLWVMSGCGLYICSHQLQEEVSLRRAK